MQIWIQIARTGASTLLQRGVLRPAQMVANYDKLQKPDKMPLLEAFITNSSNRFTHALVMEPHVRHLSPPLATLSPPSRHLRLTFS